eukprot:Gb_26266 [translate_table: standard]
MREMAEHMSITNDSCFKFMSLEAIANSMPENNNRMLSNPIGNWVRSLSSEVSRSIPKKTFAMPKKATNAPLLAPKRYYPASPPAPWHTGIAPNQQPTKFITPTLADTDVALTSLWGNRSVLNLQTAITKFKMERGIWGTLPL